MLQPRFGDRHAFHGQPSDRRHALDGHAQPFRSLHPNALRLADGALCLALVAAVGGSVGSVASPD